MENSDRTYNDLINKIDQLETELKLLKGNKTSSFVSDGSEDYFKTMIEQSPIGIQIYNMDGFVISANQAWADIWGIEDVNTVLYKFNCLTDPQIKTMGLTKYFLKAFAGEKVDIPEVKFDPKVSGFEGRLRYIKVTSYPLKRIDGTFNYIIILNEDITNEKESEIKLTELNTKLSEQNKEYELLNKELIVEKEKALENVKYNKILFDSSPIGLALAEFTGDLVNVNNAYANIIGYSINETLKLSYWDITPKKYYQDEQKQLENLNTKGTYGPYEKEYIHKSGKLIPVRLQGKIIELNGNKYIWSSVEDISEKKKAENQLKNQNEEYAALNEEYLAQNEELQSKNLELEKAKTLAEENEKKFTYILDHTNIAIYTLNINTGTYEYISPSVEEIYGYTPKEFIAGGVENSIKRFHPEDVARIDNHLSKLIEKKLEDFTPNVEYRFKHPEKGYRWMSDTRGVIFDSNNNPINLIGFAYDITDQKNAEQKLHKAIKDAEESEKQLRLIADNFVNGMIYQVVTIDENKRRFNYLSNAVNKLYGCTVKEAKENPNLIYSKIHKDDIVGLIEKEKEAISNLSIFKTEARVVNPDGSIRWSYFISKPRIIDGLTYWDGLEVDITEQKQIEQELKKAKERAEESERLKSAFLANMSHEIRTPMNSILGFSELLKQPDISQKEKKEYIDYINNGGQRLLTLISDIVDVSKIDANQLNLKITSCNLNKTIDELFNQFSISKGESQAKLITHKALNNNNCFINTDSIRLMQIFSNLIENALKFTPSGSIEFGYKIINKQLTLFVKDTGVGIEQKNFDLIFERFRQINENIFEIKSGTGLGLAIVKGLIDLLGGNIWVESEKNKGTTFFFTLPSENNDLNTKKTNHSDKQVVIESNPNISILIVEDEEDNFMYLEELLKPYSFTIVHAKNGKEALDILKQNKTISLILMDIKMPVLDGYETTQEIRKQNIEIPIIAQTAYAMSQDEKIALEMGCNDYIAKPISPDDLLAIINKHI